jgi:hypothetical protein
MIAAFRNVTSAVSVIANLNNGLLPIWLIVLGILLLRSRRSPLYAVSV